MNCSIGTCSYNRIYIHSTIVPNAPLALVGEGPSFKEIQLGKNFVGPSGAILDRVLAHAGIPRSSISILNLVCCLDTEREKKTPLAEEIDHCAARLHTELVAANPTVILLLGNLPMSQFYPGMMTISKARSKPRMWEDRVVMATYHPAAALPHRGHPEIEGMIYEDILLARSLV